MRTLTGIQPSGTLHIGNYFGAMRPAIDAQARGECFFFIADYHSLTENYDAKEKSRQILDLASDYLALGVDPKKSTVFVQSDVPAHTELA